MEQLVHVVLVYCDTLDSWGWSNWILEPKNPHFDHSHPSVAPTSQKLHSDNTGAKRVKRANGGDAGRDSIRLQNEKFLL